MKKYIVMLMICTCLFLPVSANSKKEVTLAKCTDGDTAHFLIDGKDTTVRFLAIDTPEYTKEKEPYGKEASEFTCNALKNAKTIMLEYDNGSKTTDKYGRELAWVFVDEKLLQLQLIEQGLAEVAYLYGDYVYTKQLEEAQKIAKINKLNMWSNIEPVESIPFYVYVVSGVGGILILILSLTKIKGKKTKIRKIKKIVKAVNKRR